MAASPSEGDPLMSRPLQTRQEPVQLMTVSEVCQALRICKATFYRNVMHTLPMVRIGRSPRFTVQAVNNYIANYTITGTSR
jgi:excisionase family DNA binding protein